MGSSGCLSCATASWSASSVGLIWWLPLLQVRPCWFNPNFRLKIAIGAKPGHGGRSGGPDPRSDVLVERLDEYVAHHLEPAAPIIPDRDAEFVAGLGEAQESITAVAADIAARPGTDLTAGDVAADIVLRAVGVQWNLGTVQHHQQLVFVGMQPRQQAVQGDEAGAAEK